MHHRLALARIAVALGVLAALAPPRASAQASAEALVADRPGLAYSPYLVGPGVVHLEAGVPQAAFDPEGDEYAVPVVVRYGLAPGVEVQLSASALDASGGPGGPDARAGFSTVVVGAKVGLPAEGVRGLVWALIPEVVVPTDGGDAAFLLDVPVAFEAEGFDATLSPGIAFDAGTTVLNLAGDLSQEFGGLTGFVEAAAYPVVRGGGGTPVYLGAGAMLALSDDAQVDVSFDVGVTDAASDLLVGLGIALRLD
ncbi:MAG TPA: transporter [Rubricoccaceae bacterium]|jgi:hypothetical protein